MVYLVNWFSLEAIVLVGKIKPYRVMDNEFISNESAHSKLFNIPMQALANDLFDSNLGLVWGVLPPPIELFPTCTSKLFTLEACVTWLNLT